MTPEKKLEICEVCAANKAIYTCPKCEVRSCCLTCVNRHKESLSCDGIRDKVKFIHKHEITNLDFLSDYRYLEETKMAIDRLQKNKAKRMLPVNLQKMKQAAHNRGVRLEYLPYDSSKRRGNSTYFNWSKKELFWKIEWIFPQAEHVQWITERALDSTRLSDLIENVLDPETPPKDNENDEKIKKIELFKEKIKFYQAAGLTGIKVFLKAERVPRAHSRFYELDITQSLCENLSKKTIIEFPTLYIVLKDHAGIYETIDSDDEVEEEKPVRRNINRNSNQFNQSQKKEQTDSPSPVNFFFGDMSTDD